ncbi:uncharacterized protein LOC135179292 [Pogoniulus pusillus]|uniref:uncharacterized protein LOC135179292 n=1 Tax=Pogoniulus pusillus TaxID=488313 RepID=UPI0030B99ED6
MSAGTAVASLCVQDLSVTALQSPGPSCPCCRQAALRSWEPCLGDKKRFTCCHLLKANELQMFSFTSSRCAEPQEDTSFSRSSIVLCSSCKSIVLVCSSCPSSILICVFCSSSILICVFCSSSISVSAAPASPLSQSPPAAWSAPLHQWLLYLTGGAFCPGKDSTPSSSMCPQGAGSLREASHWWHQELKPCQEVGRARARGEVTQDLKETQESGTCGCTAAGQVPTSAFCCTLPEPRGLPTFPGTPGAAWLPTSSPRRGGTMQGDQW